MAERTLEVVMTMAATAAEAAWCFGTQKGSPSSSWLRNSQAPSRTCVSNLAAKGWAITTIPRLLQSATMATPLATAHRRSPPHLPLSTHSYLPAPPPLTVVAAMVAVLLSLLLEAVGHQRRRACIQRRRRRCRTAGCCCTARTALCGGLWWAWWWCAVPVTWTSSSPPLPVALGLDSTHLSATTRRRWWRFETSASPSPPSCFSSRCFCSLGRPNATRGGGGWFAASRTNSSTSCPLRSRAPPQEAREAQRAEALMSQEAPRSSCRSRRGARSPKPSWRSTRKAGWSL
mmetsp:Transcript_27522/g.49955  ORF Transcript_27522/g.49955 Transcript_27522/m.49955 type:complete len:288 (+) Transcript_27522:125-988(+)